MSTRTIMSGDDISLAIRRIALQIHEKNNELARCAVIGIHTCGVFLADRLREELRGQLDVLLDAGTLDITLYRDDWSLIAQNPLVRTTTIDFSIDDTNVILADDVIYTGRTIRAAMDALMDYGRPATVQLACLVDRGDRQLPIQPDYVGLTTTVRAHERIHVQLREQGVTDQVVIES